MRNFLKVFILSGLAGLIAFLLFSGWHWWQSGRFEQATDNAYFQSDITSLASKISGYIVEVAVQDNQSVQSGDILFRIDDRDYKARLSKAEANVSAAMAALTNIDAERGLQDAIILQAEAKLASAHAARNLAQQNFERYQSLARTKAASKAQFDKAKATRDQADAAVKAAREALNATRKKLQVLAAMQEAADATLKQAKASRELARLDLDNTIVRAPVSGIVGNRQLRVGRLVAPGTSLLDIVPTDPIWVIANFKEVQLEHIQAGQEARIQVDGYPELELNGTVASLSPGTGSAFSLIPADNATGNFVRVVQRVPVKIQLAENPLPGRLVPGLSARVTIKIAENRE
ncbi:HlyD family secretion protein [Sneathiella chinensis]|uniref:Multidrug resistance protein A n=1 Tax=Sneathiella chinensis TaxID=349750 RepID=A0ABQ5U621_9PROT|nr:HlyD family secretion protein [Sneathiella chinensis]GLQ06762.1 multidrug resistance protein A [Sneathiella chinensis]